MRPLVLLAAVVVAAACSAPDQSARAGAEMDTAVAVAPVEGAAPGQPAATGGPSDPEIAHIVVTANQVDITAGELARSKATDPQVKAFAEQMVTDHTGVNAAATELVTRLGVTPADNPTSQQLAQGGQQNVEALQGKTGAEFDRAYIDQEVAYHQAVLDAIDQTLIPSADNGELKALLEQTRPAIEAHLQHARQIQGTLAGR